RVRELLARVGLGGGTGGKDSADSADGADRADSEVLERIARSYPHQLSGGQLQRACIALAMACDPPVLVADEPTTALDVTVQAGILDLLRSLTRDEGVAVLLITHDMAVVADVADDVAVMRHGRIVERAAVREIFRKPRHEYTRELLAAVPRLDSLRQEDPFAAVARESEAPAKATAEPVVAVEGLNVVYRNGRRTVHAVHDASLTIAPGEVLGLVGESGSGKSTIAGTLTGLVPIASGSVRVDGSRWPGPGAATCCPCAVRRASSTRTRPPPSIRGAPWGPRSPSPCSFTAASTPRP
ncbi:ATP-binding cassette domain-containing protein, partial [Actinomyces oris]|uniref:ATP-binding cassette domain-containing protein n=1 Tax=Actinomyces oris TaxID=544580 RepID=UPI00020039E1